METFTKEIYVIVYSGRDKDSGVWDEYPCLDYGYFTDKDAADKFAEHLNKEEWGCAYLQGLDDEAPRYTAQAIEPYKED